MLRKNIAFYEKEADENRYLYLDKVFVNGFSKEEFIQETFITAAHFHNSIEIVLVIKGKIRIHINGTESLLFEGDCAFVDRFDIHYYEFCENSEYFVFLISEKYLNEINGFDKKRLSSFLPKSENYDNIRMIFECMFSFWADANETFRIGAVNIILGILSKEYQQKERKIKGEVKILVETLMYINEHFKENITLSFLCEQFGYSKNYFSVCFNKFVGMNLREYINRRRIDEFEKWKEQNPEVPTYKLAEKCGFDSINTFYRAYNKYSGKS